MILKFKDKTLNFILAKISTYTVHFYKIPSWFFSGAYCKMSGMVSCYEVSVHIQFIDVMQLQNTKASDGKSTLVHYLARVVEEKHPELLQFTDELSYVERASRGW